MLPKNNRQETIVIACVRPCPSHCSVRLLPCCRGSCPRKLRRRHRVMRKQPRMGSRQRMCRLACMLVIFAGSSNATPLQWERLLPSGFSPDPRYDAAGCIFSDMETSPILYGGIYFDSSGRNAPSALDGCTGSPCTQGQVHAFDIISQGWDRIDITSQAYPPARGGHTMTSVGRDALVCGGYEPFQVSTLTVYEREKGIFEKKMISAPGGTTMDCWWLRILPDPTWEHLVVTNATIAPPSRSYQAAVFDANQSNVVIFGGEGIGRKLLNDCWYMHYEPAFNTTYKYIGTWYTCELLTAGPQPSPRRGHSMVIYSGVLFLFGGFALSPVPGGADEEESVNDVWSMTNYMSAAREWQEMTPLSLKPAKRAFHAVWMIGGLDGFKMVIHGGQSDEGSGENSVVDDTWRLDLSTNVWTKYSSDPESPPVFHSFASSVSNSSAMLFGGKTDANKLFGRVMVFDTTQGWVSVLPAGRRPEKRSGHLVAYDDFAKWMVVSHGMDWRGGLLDDTWTLNVVTGAWSRVIYPPNSVRPPKGALSAFVSTDTTLFSIGGISEGGGLIGHSNVWTLLTSTMLWKPVVMENFFNATHIYPTAQQPSGGGTWDRLLRPRGRTQSAAVKLDSFGGLLEPILILGGKADHAVDGAPLSDIWVFDSTPAQEVPSEFLNPAVQDSMASFDGEDDYIAIPLPEFARESRSMNALWVESWMRFESRITTVETLLCDFIHVDNIVLRLVVLGSSGTDSRPMLRLYFFPGSSRQQVVKTWGPVNATVWAPGTWHHFTLTLRFAPISSGQVEPDIIPAQAYLFIDGKRIRDDERFMLLDLKTLRVSHGLSKITFGGTTQDSLADTFRFFKGDMDSIRIWWLDCPPGPTACNPYGFLYPQQKFPPFKRVPDAGILDNNVQLKDVAPQILDSMFAESLPPDTPGLLVSLDFNQVENGQVYDSSTWLPEECTACGEKVCPGCQAECVYDQCKNFDVDCIENDGMSNLEFLSEHGSCECKDSVTCPKNVENCKCPRGFVRECETSGSSKNQNSAKAGAGACRSWYCACKDQLRPTCTRCLLNGQRTTPSDPCTAPSICTSRLCLYPFLSRFDTDTRDGGTPTLNPTEFLSWVNTTLKNYMPLNPGLSQPRYSASALEWFRAQFQYQPFVDSTDISFYYDANLYYDRKMAWSLFCHADEDGDGLLTAGELMKNIFGDTDADGLVSLPELAAQYRAMWGLKFKFSPDDNITEISGFQPSTYCPADVDCSIFSGGDVECEGGFVTHLISEELLSSYPPGTPAYPSSGWCTPSPPFCPNIDFIGNHPLEAANHPNFYPDPNQLLLPAALFISAMNMTAYGTVSYQSAQSLFNIDAVTWIFEDAGASSVVTPEDIDCKLLWSLEGIRCDRGTESVFGGTSSIGTTGGTYQYNDGYGGDGGVYGGYGSYDVGGGYGGNNYEFDFGGGTTGSEENYYYDTTYYGYETYYGPSQDVYVPPNYYCPEEEFLPSGNGEIEFLNAGGYIDRSQCSWVLQRDPGMSSVSIEMTYIDTEQCCDFIIIEACEEGRVGFTCNEVDTFSGSTAPLDTSLYLIPENPGYLQVRFTADSSYTLTGFVLAYTRSNEVPVVVADPCPNEAVLGPFGTITYLEDGGYKDNSDCSWVLPEGFSSVSIEFTTLATESCCDSVVVESCRSGIVGVSCTELARFAGTELPAAVTYTTPEDAFVFIRFVSDGSVTGPGFELTYERGNDGGSGVSVDTVCPDGQFIAYTGPASIDYDLSGAGGYGNNQQCSWLIRGDTVDCLAVTFDMLSTEDCCDLVHFDICDGGICTLITVASGTSSPTLHFAVPASGWLAISFSSDQSVTESGFILQYEAADVGSCQNPCVANPCDCDPCHESCNPQFYFCTGATGGGAIGGGATGFTGPTGGGTTGGSTTGSIGATGGGASGGSTTGYTGYTGYTVRRLLADNGGSGAPTHPVQEGERRMRSEEKLGTVRSNGAGDGRENVHAWTKRKRSLAIGDFIAGRDPRTTAVHRRRAIRRFREKRKMEHQERTAPVVAPGKGARARGRALQGRPLRGGAGSSQVDSDGLLSGRGAHRRLQETQRAPEPSLDTPPATDAGRAHHTPGRALLQGTYGYGYGYGNGCFGTYGEYYFECPFGSFGFQYSMPSIPGFPGFPASSPAPAQSELYYNWVDQCFDAAKTCLGRTLEADPRVVNPRHMLGDCPCANLGSGCSERAHSGAVVNNGDSRDAIFELFASSPTATSISRSDLSAKVSQWSLGPDIVTSFDTIDEDSNGGISAEELYEYLLRGADGNVDWFVAIFDRDCNGRIGFEEASFFCVAYEFDWANYDRFFFHEFRTAQMEVSAFYNRAVMDLPLCPFKVDANWQEPRSHLTSDGLRSYLLVLKYVREKDINKDGWLYFGSASTAEWSVTDTQRSQEKSPWLARLGGKTGAGDLEKAGPELIFELIMGSPDADGQGSDEVNTPNIQGWSGLALAVYDVNQDSKLQESEARDLAWYTNAYFTFLDSRNASRTPDRALEESELKDMDHIKFFMFLTLSFLEADTNGDNRISLNEWIAADWDADPTAPSFSTVDKNANNFVSDIEALHAVDTTSFGGYLKCPFLPCQDCSTWDAGFGGCETYQQGEVNHEYCTSDYDQFTLYAVDACPQACLTGNVTYICGVNVENSTLVTEATLAKTDTGLAFTVLASRIAIPKLALPSGMALGVPRTVYENPSSASTGERSLRFWWRTDPVWTESAVGLDAPRLPTLNGGVGDAVLNLDLKREEGRNSFSSPVSIAMGVDPCQLRVASGCVLVNNDALQLCAPGQAHLHTFNESTGVWDVMRGPRTALEIPIPALEKPSWCAAPVDVDALASLTTAAATTTMGTTPSPTATVDSMVTIMRPVGCSCADFNNGSCTDTAQPTVQVDTTIASEWWMVVARPHCCIYNGTGKPCSEKVCRKTTDEKMSPAYLGEGATTKKPSVVRSTRPWFVGNTFEQNTAQLRLERLAENAEPYIPRTGWLQVCITGLYHGAVCPVSTIKPKQPGSNWFQARFGHAATAISGSRVVIHGGFGCNNNNCSAYVPFFDTWELYIDALGSDSQAMFQLHELSPASYGLGGLVALPVAGQDHRLFVIGGTRESVTLSVLKRTARPASRISLSHRELKLRDRQMQQFLSSTFPGASGHSVVGNDTTAVVFGGFVSNSMTSGVFTLDLTAATFDSAFKRMQIIGTAPLPRAYSPMFMAGAESMLMVGGVASQINDDGLGVKRAGLKDVWQYSFVNSRWTQLHSRWPVSNHAFQSSTSYTVSGSTLLLVHGGVSDAYVPGVTSSMQYQSRAPQPWSYGPGPQQASAEFKALLPGEWLANSTKSPWIRVRPLTSGIRCMSISPVCQAGTTDDYWGCYSAPYPWWAKIATDFTLSPCSWSKADASCEKSASDGSTAGCYRPLPNAMTCEPPPRYMHTIASGAFLGGRDAVVMTGGMDMYGQLLSDTWLYDLSTFPKDGRCDGCSFMVKVQLFVKLNLLSCKLSYWTALRKLFAELFQVPRADQARIYMEVVEAPEAVLNPSSQLCAYQCTAENTWNLVTKQARNKDIGERITLRVSIPNPKGYFGFLKDTCVTAGSCKNAYREAAQGSDEDDLQTSTLSSIFTMENRETPQTLEACYEAAGRSETAFVERCLTHREARVAIRELDTDLGCTDYCAKGICQFDNIARYADGVVGCTSAGPCAGDGVCSLPGPRYGHSATSFKYRGGVSTLLIFGGEVTSSSGTELRNDVVVGSFQSTSMTYSRLKIGCTGSTPCPQPRRDASIVIIDNRGGSSGKLIVFGGMIGRGQDYFSNDMEFVNTLDDVWVLNLDQIHADGQGQQCLYYARCSVTMRWSQLEVPGERPASRFGASLAALDQFNEGILFLADGSRKQIETNAVLQTNDIDDLFVFQLHDPFYKHCAATGKGLTQAIAGRTTTFNIACTDILGEPANGAQFAVTITGGPTCEGCPSVFPPVIGIGEGLYECQYVPIAAGEYVVTVKVGRGGADFQDLVGGDPGATRSNLQADILKQNKGNNGLTAFTLLVSAGPTSRRTSVALGEAVTLSTAGITSTFLINSVDAFQNLRPGGDDMSVVFRLAGSVDIPNAGKVLDNNDGSYVVQYAITQAGQYSVSISVNGVVGVGSPFNLKVEAQLADTALTYSYGEFLDAKTGKTFSVYVQTRDRYGNFISTDPSLFPLGSDTIALEYCKTTVLGGTCAPTNTQCTCQGGQRNTDVSIIVNYGVGPNGPTRNGQVGGEPYFGLYQITYFPFTSGKSTPLIRHNQEYIKCYFHTGTPVLEVSVAEADACVRANIIRELQKSSTARALGGMEPVSSIRTHPLYWNNPAFSARPSFGWQGLEEESRRGSEWRLDSSDTQGVFRRNTRAEVFDFTQDDNDRFAVSETFEAPSTQTTRDMLSVVPAVCFLVGTGIALLQFAVEFYSRYKKNRYSKIHDEYIKGLEAKGISVKASIDGPDRMPIEGPDRMPVEGDGYGLGIEAGESAEPEDRGAGVGGEPRSAAEVPVEGVGAGQDGSAAPAAEETPAGGPSTLNSPADPESGQNVMTAGQDLGQLSGSSEIEPAPDQAKPRMGSLRGSESQDSVSQLLADVDCSEGGAVA